VSWVLVYCLWVITWLVDVCNFDYEIVCNCMIKHFSTIAYPFCLFVCFMCGFLFLWWSSTCWCQQMWELLVVVRVMKTPLLSFGLDFAIQVSFKVVTHVFVCLLDNYFGYCRSLYSVLYWHRGVPQYFILSTLDICKEWRYTPRLCFLYYYVWHFI